MIPIVARRLIILAASLGAVSHIANFAQGAAEEAMRTDSGLTSVLARSVLAGVLEAAPGVSCSSGFLAFCALAGCIAAFLHEYVEGSGR